MGSDPNFSSKEESNIGGRIAMLETLETLRERERYNLKKLYRWNKKIKSRENK